MVTILKIGDTAIELTGWIAYPVIVAIVAACITGVFALIAALAE
jgi:hypothetical protein